MKVTYTGSQQELRLPQRRKLDVKFAKLSKLLDSRRGEKEAHVILTSERHLTRAEVTVRFYDHALVAVAEDPEAFNALNTAIERLEKQLLKLRAKRRDTKRGVQEAWPEGGEAAGEGSAAGESAPAGRVQRVNHRAGRKPMTLEEALLEMERGRDYVVYHDSKTDRVSVLVRRRDGNFDLIEG